MVECTLCGSRQLKRVVAPDDYRQYYNCGKCKLIFADPSFHLSRKTEASRYRLHHNGEQYEGYVKFLSRVIDPCIDFLNASMRGLDYGCGPVPTLSALLKRRGLTCFDYDPLFGFDHPYDCYDFIFASECFEHFNFPRGDITKIDSLLRKGGYLGVMTERWETIARFRTWYYKKDPTHVTFFHRDTFGYLCDEFGYEIKYKDRNRVIILQKV